MTTLIQVGRSSGWSQRCDARCHNATGPDCDCVCGGRFHGRGASGTLREAVEQTALRFVDELERAGHDAGNLRDLLEADPEARAQVLDLAPPRRRRRIALGRRSGRSRDWRQLAMLFGRLERPGEGEEVENGDS